MYMRDDIINVLENCDKAVDIYELQDLLEVHEVDELKELNDELRKLEDEAIIYRSHKDKYMMIEKSHLRKGVMRATKKGYGFVEVDDLEDDIYIDSEYMNGAIHDDIVLVEITQQKFCLIQFKQLINRYVMNVMLPFFHKGFTCS